MPKKICFIASRLKCADGLCIKSEIWISHYLKLGYEVHLITGKLGEETELPSLIIPELDFKNPEVRGVKRILFGTKLDKEGEIC